MASDSRCSGNIRRADGKTWSFHLPAEQGSYDERRVYKLDLFERPVEDAAEVMSRYVSRPRVEAGEALESARTEYRSRNRRSQARAAIPDAWRELVTKGDELLVELLTSAVESKAGVRPEADDVAEYLASLGRLPREQGPPLPRPARQPAVATPKPVAQRPTAEASRSGTLVILGRRHEYNNAKEAMITILRELALRDPSFLERCAQHPDVQGRTRRYIARTPQELYPERPDLVPSHQELPGGWFVSTNLNNALKGTIVRLATEVAGLKFGNDVIVDF
jgi:predicted type IV restriction endonuclease